MEKLLTAKQAADQLNKHIKTLYRQIRENSIALDYVQVSPRRLGFRPADIQRYLDAREVTRDGSGRPRKVNVKKPYHFMTDAEAQAFFADVKKDADGNIIIRKIFGREEDWEL